MKKKLIKRLLFVLVLTGCIQNKKDTSGDISIFRKNDDSTTIILKMQGDNRFYTYKSNLNIDIESLEDLGEFLIDKNKVYRKYDISDGTLILVLDNVDRKTFQTFGNSIYAKDKLNIYDSRNGLIEKADVKTFKIVKINNQTYGKDKNNYYFWDDIIIYTIGFNDLINN